MNKTILLFSLGGMLIVLYTLKKGRRRYFLSTALCGMASLLAVNTLGHLWRLNLPVNIFTAAVSAVGGMPGVILLILLSVPFL